MTKEYERPQQPELPRPLEVNFVPIPEELQQHHSWVVWQYRSINGEIKKPPYDPRSGMLASVANPSTWGSFGEAQRAYATGRYAGIGFMLHQDNDIIGIDIDHCYLKDKNRYNNQAHQIIERLATYTERSPSGDGIHLFLRGQLPGPYRRAGNTELYQDHRYLTITGHTITDKSAIENRQTELENVYTGIFRTKVLPAQPENTGGEGEPAPRSLASSLLDEETLQEILRKAYNAKNGETFQRYYEGDASLWQQTAGSSQSNADFTLCLLLLYWTNDDKAQVDRLFRRSGLMRDKWDRKTGTKTYGELTIGNALQRRRLGRR